jgi:hypothetical protein
MSEAEIMSAYAPKGSRGEPLDATTPELLAECGIDVRDRGELLGRAGEGLEEGNGVGASSEGLSASTFCDWLQLSAMTLGSVVAKWWTQLPAGMEGEAEAFNGGS